MNRRMFLSVLVIALGATNCAPVRAQTCQQWTDVLLQSFLPKQTDDKALRELSNLAPEQYSQFALNVEKTAIQQVVKNVVRMPGTEEQMRLALQRFYAVGNQLYGTHLSANDLAIVSNLDPNAFATGSALFIHKGIADYFLNPQSYLIEIGYFPSSGYTVEEYNWLIQNFPWQNDWNSLYFVLAHEAAHNLMQHRDVKILTPIVRQYGDYRQAVLERRKDIAEGKEGGGVKRYFSHSIQNFLQQFNATEEYRGIESEADAVALVLMQQSGLDPTAAMTASQRLSSLISLLSSPARGWHASVSEIMCSDHPAWEQRIQQESMNVNCLRFSGQLCNRHAPFVADTLLSQLKNSLAEMDKYDAETDRISAATPAEADTRYAVQFEVKPDDAQLSVDGENIQHSKLSLAVGPHSVVVSKYGFETTTKKFVVFPDVPLKINLKLKKAK